MTISKALIMYACQQERALVTASKNHEKLFLSGTILEKKISQKWILDIDDQALCELERFSTFDTENLGG